LSELEHITTGVSWRYHHGTIQRKSRRRRKDPDMAMSELTDHMMRTIHGEPDTSNAIVVAFTDTAGTSATALTAGVTYMITTTVDCHIAFGSTPTADTDDPVFPTGAVAYLTMTNAYKFSAVRAGSTSGKISATPMIGYRV